MTLSEPAVSAVVFGRSEGLTAPIVEALRCDGVIVELVGNSLLCDDSRYDSVDSTIMVVEAPSTDALVGRICCVSRRRLRARESDLCNQAVSTVLAHGASRVLIVCDARRLPIEQRARVIGRLWDSAVRIKYESAINGAGQVVTSYAVINSDDDVHRIAAAAAAWHRGYDVRVPRTEHLSATVDSGSAVQIRRHESPQFACTRPPPECGRLLVA